MRILSKTDNITNTSAIDFWSQENQNHYNQQNKQYTVCKYHGGLEHVTLELIPDIILEEEEDRFLPVDWQVWSVG